MSTKKLNIYQKINRVMARVGVVKYEDKRVNNQYSYLSHDAVVRSVRQQMVIEGIVMRLAVADMVQNGNRTELKAAFHFVNIDDPQDFVEVQSIGFGIDGSDKGPGKAISYAKKYALLTCFLLEAGDHADVERFNIAHLPEGQITEEPEAEAAKPAPRRSKKKAGPTIKDVKRAFMEATATADDARELFAHACDQLEIDRDNLSDHNVLSLKAWLDNSFAKPESTADQLKSELLKEHLPAYKRRG